MGRPVNSFPRNVLNRILDLKALRIKIEEAEELERLWIEQRDGLEKLQDLVLHEQYAEAEQILESLRDLPVPDWLRVPAYEETSNGDIQKAKRMAKEVMGMKRTAALAEAKRRWGEYGHIQQDSFLKKIGFLTRVPGYNKIHFEILGQGPTWEAAFQNADESRLNQDQRKSRRPLPVEG